MKTGETCCVAADLPLTFPRTGSGLKRNIKKQTRSKAPQNQMVVFPVILWQNIWGAALCAQAHSTRDFLSEASQQEVLQFTRDTLNIWVSTLSTFLYLCRLADNRRMDELGQARTTGTPKRCSRRR